MNTHELAGALRKFSMILKRGPNIDINEVGDSTGILGLSTSSKSNRTENLPMALSALLSLSRVDKQEWIELIKDLGLDIVVRPRDASRDILGKVLKVLEAEPAARESLKRQVKSRGEHASPELARALSSLLGR